MKILCFGDSNTYGYDPRSWFGDSYPACWVDLLAEKLGCTVVNAGENGRTIPTSANQLERLLERHSADFLIIMLGTNDLLQGNAPVAVAERMARFLEQICFEKSRILLIAPPPMKLGEWIPSQALVDASLELCQHGQSLAENLGIRYADTGDWGIPMAFDGVHFTEEGHRIFAERLYCYFNMENNHGQCE